MITINSQKIKQDTIVVCADNKHLATVDHMDGANTIKLKRDKQGQHHYIPLSWVASIDDKIHLNRSGEQAMREWSTTAKASEAASLKEVPVPVDVKPFVPYTVESVEGTMLPVQH